MRTVGASSNTLQPFKLPLQHWRWEPTTTLSDGDLKSMDYATSPGDGSDPIIWSHSGLHGPQVLDIDVIAGAASNSHSVHTNMGRQVIAGLNILRPISMFAP